MVKAGYKLTEAGEIPDAWTVRPFEETLKIANGQVNPREEPYRDFILVAPDHIEGGTGRLIKRSTARDQGAISGKYLFKPGDIIYSKIRPYLKKVVAVNFEGLCSADMYPLSSLDGVQGDFCFHSILGERFTTFVESFSARSGIPKLNREDLSQFNFILPPYCEQKAIADALSDVDALIGSLEKLIAKKRDIKTGTMQQLLTGKKRLPGFGEGRGTKQTELGEIPEDWDAVPLGEVLRIRHGKSQKEVEAADGEYPILATGGVIGSAREPLYSKPSVLIGRKGTIDVPYYMETPFWTVDTLFYSEVSNKADPKFLFYKFGFIDWYQYNEASGVPSLSSTTIEKIIQALPSKRSEQEAISSFISDFDNEISYLEKRLTKTKAIKQGMMQELLTGKTRLV